MSNIAAADSILHSDKIASKADLGKLSTQMAQLEARLTWRLLVAVGVIIAAVGLIVRL